MDLQVMLKLQIDLIDDDDHWRGDIGEFFNKQQWNDWFNSYEQALSKYAKLAQRLQVEQFSVGCELIAASDQESNWRKLILNIRKIYKGIVIDSSNWGYLDDRGGEETHKKWWDAVDIMGIDAYYPICQNITDPTLEQLIQGWQPVLERYRNLTSTFNKPILLSEIGYCSSTDCQRGQKTKPFDYYKQALYYKAAFQAFQNVDFPFYGFFWWTWNTDPSSGGLQDECITPQGKPAEYIIREYYGGTQILPQWPEPAQCPCTV